MTTPIYEFPRGWYQFSSRKYPLQSVSQVSPSMPLLGIKRVARGAAQIWTCEFTMTQQQDPDRQQIEAFFHRLDGQAGLLRMGDPSRLDFWYNRSLIGTRRTFTDGTSFTDGTGFADGLMPPTAYVAAVASKGDSFIEFGGLLASTAQALTRGDVFEIAPNGIRALFPHFYEIMHGNDTDANGCAGVEIRPRLRQGIAVGDQVIFSYACSVFRMIDDSQAVIEVTPPVVGNLGFSLVEALDQVP